MGVALALVLAAATSGDEAFREPVALAVVGEPAQLVAGCADGTLVSFDGRRVVDVQRVGQSIADLTLLDDGRTLLVADESGQAVVLVRDGKRAELRPKGAPTVIATAGPYLVVGSKWARTIERWEAFGSGEPATLSLPFSPGEISGLPERDLAVVADAFGGEVAVVELSSWSIVGHRELPGHNITGVEIAGGSRVLFTHQILDSLAHTTFEDVHWGNLVRNVVREVPLDWLTGRIKALGARSRVAHLGDVGAGAADPSSLLVDDEGRCFVTLGGTGEVLALDPTRFLQRRHAVGRRPVDAVFVDDDTLAVANAFDGTVSFLDVESGEVETVRLGGPPPDDAVARGRRSFFDGALSHDGWMSCHSCHSAGHTSGGLADTLGDGSHGSPKRVLSLLGTADTAPYAWSGQMATLEEQIDKTLRTTMHADEIDEGVAADLAAFLRTLPAPPRPGVATVRASRGAELFRDAGCVDCHAPPLFTSADTYDVGVQDEAGRSEFNPPSLRGVGRRARLFHDGRFRRIEDLLAQAGHPGTEELDPRDIADVAAYLRTL